MQRIFENIFIMDENDALSKYNKIPLGHNHTNAPFTPKSTSNLRSALHIRYSIVIPRFISRVNMLIPNNHYNHGYPNTFDYNHYVYSDYLVCSVPAIAQFIRY